MRWRLLSIHKHQHLQTVKMPLHAPSHTTIPDKSQMMTRDLVHVTGTGNSQRKGEQKVSSLEEDGRSAGCRDDPEKVKLCSFNCLPQTYLC